MLKSNNCGWGAETKAARAKRAELEAIGIELQIHDERQAGLRAAESMETLKSAETAEATIVVDSR